MLSLIRDLPFYKEAHLLARCQPTGSAAARIDFNHLDIRSGFVEIPQVPDQNSCSTVQRLPGIILGMQRNNVAIARRGKDEFFARDVHHASLVAILFTAIGPGENSSFETSDLR